MQPFEVFVEYAAEDDDVIQNPERRSTVEKYLAPAKASSESSILGNGPQLKQVILACSLRDDILFPPRFVSRPTAADLPTSNARQRDPRPSAADLPTSNLWKERRRRAELNSRRGDEGGGHLGRQPAADCPLGEGNPHQELTP
ncbi:unnamed protein product [Lampetra fluviatilis]